MTADKKKGGSAEGKPDPGDQQPKGQTAAGEQQDTADKKRAAWVRKTPTEKMVAEIEKQEKRVADLREELKKEEKSLLRLLDAKKILEAS